MPRPFDVSHVAVSVPSSADCASSSASIRAAASAGAASPPAAGSSIAPEPVPATELTATSACLASASFTALPSTFRDPGRSAASVSGDVAGSRRPAHFIAPLPSRTTPSSRPKASSGRTSRMPGPPATPDPGRIRHAVADQAVHHASADVQIVPPRRSRLRGHCERGCRVTRRGGCGWGARPLIRALTSQARAYTAIAGRTAGSVDNSSNSF